jgi:short subunit dehydrogenase-like uncharacterized protein
MQFLIYGANGYTGALIAREAARRGLKPILAGRSAAAIEPLARELGLEARVFGVEQPRLEGVELVLHCAGPFSRTSAPMVSRTISTSPVRSPFSRRCLRGAIRRSGPACR